MGELGVRQASLLALLPKEKKKRCFWDSGDEETGDSDSQVLAVPATLAPGSVNLLFLCL